jgi:hypothetical protein
MKNALIERASNAPSQAKARRGFLLAGAAAFGGAAGAALGYREHDRVFRWSHGDPVVNPAAAAMPEFARRTTAILKSQARQTLETVQQLKSKYESAVFGKIRVWDMIEKLGMCIDPADTSLLMTSQYVHVQQILEGMERDGIQDRDLILIALLHDLGKVMLLTAEVPEHIVGYTAPLAEFPRGVGLDHVVFQFGHDEIVYSRLKDHVPEHVAWTIRHHSASLGAIEPYLNDRERGYRDRYLAKFQKYDRTLKSHTHLPRVDMAKYRPLIEEMFPQPILF